MRDLQVLTYEKRAYNSSYDIFLAINIICNIYYFWDDLALRKWGCSTAKPLDFLGKMVLEHNNRETMVTMDVTWTSII